MAGERQANGEDLRAIGLLRGAPGWREEFKGVAVQSCRGFGDSSEPVRARRGGGDLRVFHCARPCARSLPPLPTPPPPEREPSQLPGRSSRHRALPFAQGGGNARGPSPTGPHPMKLGVARPSSCPSSPPAAVVAVAVAVTSRPLRLGEGGGGEGRGEKQESVKRACARVGVCPQTGSHPCLPPPPGSYFPGLVFLAGGRR